MSMIQRLFAGCCLAALVACGDDGGAVVDAPKAPSDAAIDAPGTTTPDADCFTNPDPNSHIQIINACTTAQKIYKDSDPPLLLPNGSLPPLP